jgi:hypothetical protein
VRVSPFLRVKVMTKQGNMTNSGVTEIHTQIEGGVGGLYHFQR